MADFVLSDNLVVLGTVDLQSTSMVLSAANAFISLGPTNIVAQSGDIRFGNTRFIAWRNTNNNGDLQILSVDEDDILNIGSSGLGSIRFLNDTVTIFGAAGSLSLGSAPALTGTIRLANTNSLVWRNAANSVDRALISFDGSDVAQWGNPSTLHFWRGNIEFDDRVDFAFTTTFNGSATFNRILTVDRDDLTAMTVRRDGESTIPVGNLFAPARTRNVFEVDTINATTKAVAARQNENLVDGNFASFTNWTDVGDFSEGPGVGDEDYEYLFAIGSGTLTQANGTLAVAPKNNTVYEFTYDVSSKTGTPVIFIAPPFASVATNLDLSIQGLNRTVQFTSGPAANVADFVLENNGGVGGDKVTLDNVSLREVFGGNLSVAGVSELSSFAEGGTAKIVRKTSHEKHTLSLAATSDTTKITVPSGARLLAVSFNVNTVVVDSAGDDTWSAAFVTGSTAVLATAESPTLDTKVDTQIADEIASAITEIRFTPNAGNFTAGVIEIVVYFETLTSLADEEGF